MLKKFIFIAFLFSFSSLSFANGLTVRPENPSSWEYIHAIVTVNDVKHHVGAKKDMEVSVNDIVSLTEVTAMNGEHPRIDDSCRNIQIYGRDWDHFLAFELRYDGIIHCIYYSMPHGQTN